MGAARNPQHALPLQVAAVCYRRRGPFRLSSCWSTQTAETNGRSPRAIPSFPSLTAQAAEREAWEEAGVSGNIEPRHFCLYIHSKGVFWKPPGVREFVIKAFLLEVERTKKIRRTDRNPTWFSPDDAKKILAKGREVKYARELQAVIDRAMERHRHVKSNDRTIVLDKK